MSIRPCSSCCRSTGCIRRGQSNPIPLASQNMGARSQTGSATCQIELVWRKVDAYHGYHVGAKFALFRPIFLLRQGNKPSARSLAPPLAQKGTLGSPTRLQTPSRRFAVAVGSSLSGNSSQASRFLPIDNAKDPARPGGRTLFRPGWRCGGAEEIESCMHFVLCERCVKIKAIPSA